MPPARRGNRRARRGFMRRIVDNKRQSQSRATSSGSLVIRSAAVARLLGLALALASFAFLSSCGSGAVGGPPPTNDPSRITILPAVATAFSGLPTTFVISGGTGSYIVASSNQSIVPVSGAISGSSFTVVPNPVTANTTVTLTVRDTGTTP